MAFMKNRTQQTQSQPTDDTWKARGFLNLYMPMKDGSEQKIGFIALQGSKTLHAQMCDVAEKGEEQLEKLLAKVIVRYNSATPTDKGGIDLD
jgi:hypothetical protein